MDNIHVTLAIVIASFAAAVTYVKANTAPLAASADIFACQQVSQSQYAPAVSLASEFDAPGRPACPQMNKQMTN